MQGKCSHFLLPKYMCEGPCKTTTPTQKNGKVLNETGLTKTGSKRWGEKKKNEKVGAGVAGRAGPQNSDCWKKTGVVNSQGDCNRREKAVSGAVTN